MLKDKSLHLKKAAHWSRRSMWVPDRDPDNANRRGKGVWEGDRRVGGGAQAVGQGPRHRRGLSDSNKWVMGYESGGGGLPLLSDSKGRAPQGVHGGGRVLFTGPGALPSHDFFFFLIFWGQGGGGGMGEERVSKWRFGMEGSGGLGEGKVNHLGRSRGWWVENQALRRPGMMGKSSLEAASAMVF